MLNSKSGKLYLGFNQMKVSNSFFHAYLGRVYNLIIAQILNLFQNNLNVSPNNPAIKTPAAKVNMADMGYFSVFQRYSHSLSLNVLSKYPAV